MARLFIGEGGVDGQYQINAYGGPATVSSLTLNDWRPIDMIPRHLIDDMAADLAELDGMATDLVESDTFGSEEQNASSQKGIKRLSAWIRRSGKESKNFVVRVLRLNHSKDPGFTDYHFSARGGPRSAERPSLHIYPREGYRSDKPQVYSPIMLHHVFGHEGLPDSSPTSELHDNPIQELPPMHSLSELVANDAISSPRGYLYNRPDRSNDDRTTTEVLTRSGTTHSNLSSADTAIASIRSEQQHTTLKPVRTLARGLGLIGSVKYRCNTDDVHTAPSPTGLASLAGGFETYGRSTADENCHLYEPLQASSPGRQQGLPLWPTVNTLPASTSATKAVELRDARKASSYDVVAYPAPGMTLTRMEYQQDLHVTSDLIKPSNTVQVSQGSGWSTTFRSKLIYQVNGDDRCGTWLRTSDEAAFLKGKPVSIKHPPPKGADTTDIISGADAQVNHGDVQTPGSSPLSTPPVHLDAALRIADSAARAANAIGRIVPSQDNGSEATGERIDPSVVSPISPLKNEEAQKPGLPLHSTPVTPLSPGESNNKITGPSEDSIRLSEAVTQAASIASTLTTHHNAVEGSHDKSGSDAERTLLGRTAMCSSRVVKRSETGIDDDRYTAPLTSTAKPDAGNIGDLSKAIPHLADFVDYQQPGATVEEMPIPPIGYLSDDKIPTRYRNTRFRSMPSLNTDLADTLPRMALSTGSMSEEAKFDEDLLNTGTQGASSSWGHGKRISSPPILHHRHGPQEHWLAAALCRREAQSGKWYGPRRMSALSRTCSCGENLYDDFLELRPGAASLLEARLNRHVIEPYSAPRSSSRSSARTFASTPNGSTPATSSATSFPSASSRYSASSRNSFSGFPKLDRDTISHGDILPFQGPRYLLTCTTEAINTPKLSQLPPFNGNILSDKDLAVALRDHYQTVNRSWSRRLRLRGLTSIEFVQFYEHRNRFADIRKCPDIPSSGSTSDYEFDRSDLLPPVGPNYLVHLFQHPDEYDGETIAYHSIPKKLSRLQGGIGWGIQLTEGFVPARIWIFMIIGFLLFGCIFAVTWTAREDDLQGAVGVASFVTMLASMAFGLLQACLG
ncbi:hypothetical protein LTR37_017713 [Vermiconidia calcicola]|uniref:Uncharacterized protein n=1 Tax=Vermiconidia calcicola TaxID=1690605 RepID=A0ACC3MJ64_9PEZI|nr:hypothetical protein LTR37_017713 [Vermiconidia calcicola]